jgi:putative glutamine amidotransferase
MVGIASPAFFESFKAVFPQLELVTSENIKNMKLIIFPGGADVNTARYQERMEFSAPPDLKRDELEFGILKSIMSISPRTRPWVLGVCRGLQLVNVGLGGSLFQDLRFNCKVQHSGIHSLDIVSKTPVTELFSGINVNSFHHQGINRLGSGLATTAFHKGIPEIVEGNKIILVQFHPEWMNETEKMAIAANKLFQYAYEKATAPQKVVSRKTMVLDEVGEAGINWAEVLGA